jgi:VIT1/CCC1 family predicted Fe2+/Mn2+ transporter
LAQEQDAAAVYRALARKRHGEEREILLALARAEERHAAHWSERLHPAEQAPGRVGARARLLSWLARRLGSLLVLSLVQRAEAGGHYDTEPDATAAMAADERVHALVVAGLAQRQRARAAGWFRAAVFGANDGLVSNFSLVLGVVGAGSSSQVILLAGLAGLAGLLAGALSMAAGEYVSVRSQRELLDAAAHELDPATLRALHDHEAGELALVFRAKGLPADQAEQRAPALLGDDGAELSREAEVADQDVGRVRGDGGLVELRSLRQRRRHPDPALRGDLGRRSDHDRRGPGWGRVVCHRGDHRRTHRWPPAAPGPSPARHRRRRRDRHLWAWPHLRRHHRLTHRASKPSNVYEAPSADPAPSARVMNRCKGPGAIWLVD